MTLQEADVETKCPPLTSPVVSVHGSAWVGLGGSSFRTRWRVSL